MCRYCVQLCESEVLHVAHLIICRAACDNVISLSVPLRCHIHPWLYFGCSVRTKMPIDADLRSVECFLLLRLRLGFRERKLILDLCLWVTSTWKGQIHLSSS
jgi:hypothetical protein